MQGRLACRAFLALADLVAMVFVTGYKGQLEHTSLDNQAEEFLQLFCDAFGSDYMTPKYHWLLHFGDHLHDHGMLLNCFVLERRHRFAKQAATTRTNTSKHSSTSLLMDVTDQHMSKVIEPQAFDYSLGPVNGKKISKRDLGLLQHVMDLNGSEEILSSKCSRYDACSLCKQDDVVLIREANGYIAGKVLLHVSVNGYNLTMVEKWEREELHLNQWYITWSLLNARNTMCETTSIAEALIYIEPGESNYVKTMIPYHFRDKFGHDV